jgi:NADH-quinone oxidoreductase subunit C
MSRYQALEKHILTSLSESLEPSENRLGELTFWVNAMDIIPVLEFLKTDPLCHFELLIDLCGVDYPERPLRFEVVYHFLSVKHHTRVRLKLMTDDKTAIPSVVQIYSSALWLEREAFDMFGICFEGHPDMRRLLTDYNFEHYPLRKDFPLTGYTEVRYDDTQKRVIYEPVELQQDFRSFDFQSPWEGMKTVLERKRFPSEEEFKS